MGEKAESGERSKDFKGKAGDLSGDSKGSDGSVGGYVTNYQRKPEFMGYIFIENYDILNL